MRSPFPGMDPYLERYWGHIHSSLITFSKVAIQRQLGGDLIARSEDRVYIDDEDSDPIRESYLQIIDAADGERVVTVIEFVSPSNTLKKAARKSYHKKQGECLDAGTSLVEVDLTRAGRRRMLVDMNELPLEKRGEYLVSVHRACGGPYGRREGYDIQLRERLPAARGT